MKYFSGILLLFIFFYSCNGQDKSSKKPTNPRTNTVLFSEGYGLKPDPSSQISEYIRHVYQDKKGNFWFGTNGDGVCRYDGKELVYFNKKRGFSGYAVRGIKEAANGDIWFATDSGVCRYNGTSFTTYSKKDGLPDNNIWSLYIDRKGTVWAGTAMGTARFDGASFKEFAIPKADVTYNSSFGPKLVWSFFEDKLGNFWFGTDGAGVQKYDGRSFTSYTTNNGLCNNNIDCIIGDKAGNIWFGTRGGGVCRYDGKTFTSFTEKDGLGKNSVWTMLEDNAGNIWFGTGGGGATRYDGKSFTTFTEKAGLTGNHIQSIFEDKAGNLWFGFSGGLFRFDGTSFINVTKKGPWL